MHELTKDRKSLGDILFDEGGQLVGKVSFYLINHIGTERQKLHVLDTLYVKLPYRQHTSIRDAFQSSPVQLFDRGRAQKQHMVHDRVLVATVLEDLVLTFTGRFAT